LARLGPALAVVILGAATATAEERGRSVIVGDEIPVALTAEPGNPDRGRAIVADRQKGLCVLCHDGPFPQERFKGNIGPSLAGVGLRFSVGQLRLRLVDAQAAMPGTIMPSYSLVAGKSRVSRAYAEKPLLSPQDIEDTVAFLATLREMPDPGAQQ
jgi:L-cysteine S-thiosulfotransferase